MAFCPECKAEMSLTDIICPECGYDFSIKKTDFSQEKTGLGYTLADLIATGALAVEVAVLLAIESGIP